MAYGAFDPYSDQQQDEFTSSYFQQPQQPYAAPEPERDTEPSPTPSASSGRDPFTSSFMDPRKAAAIGRGAAPASSSDRGAVGPTSAGASFDYGSLVNKVKTSADPREQAIAKDQLARATYAQLKQAGHEVNWEGDNLVVDGRPYVIGDGASAQPAPAAAPSGKTPASSPYQSAGALAGAPGGRTQGGASTWDDAYADISGRISPYASREEMEAAIEDAFGGLPGYGGAYKESVKRNGQWFDMITGYGGANAAWSGLNPKGPSAPGLSSSFFSSSFANPMSPYGGSSASGGGQLGAEGARGVDLTSSLNPAILAYLQQQPPEPDPMTPSYAGLLR